jgi:hypothetical protein
VGRARAHDTPTAMQPVPGPAQLAPGDSVPQRLLSSSARGHQSPLKRINSQSLRGPADGVASNAAAPGTAAAISLNRLDHPPTAKLVVTRTKVLSLRRLVR